MNEVRMDVSACRAALQARQAQQYAQREKRRQAARDSVRAAAASVFPRYPAVRRAYLFGSAVRPGALRMTSDVDIAIEGVLDAETYFAVWRALEMMVGEWPLDVVELWKDLRFASRVREHGELIYERPDSDFESGYRG